MQHQIGQKFIFRLKSQEIYEMHKVSCTRQFVLLHISHKNGVTEPGHAVFRYFAAFFGAAGVSGRITFSFSMKPVLAGMYSSM